MAETLTPLEQLYIDVGNFLGCVGLLDAIVDQSPEEVLKEGWSERLEMMSEKLGEWTNDLRLFGEAYDASGGEV